MANDVTQQKRPMLPISGRFAKSTVEDLGEGIKAGICALSIAGNRFGINQRKTYTPLRPDQAMQIEVVILRGAKTQSKAYFGQAYDGSSRIPDCWSSDSIRPDTAVENKISAQCNGCPKDAWVTAPNGRRQKMCNDHKRVALVPADDMKNEAFGGALLFRVPAGSLANLNQYSDELMKMDIPYFAYTTIVTLEIGADRVTRLTFAYGRPLTDEEADLIIAMREDQRVLSMVSDQIVPEEGETNGTTPPQKAAAVEQKASVQQTPQRAAPANARPATPQNTSQSTVQQPRQLQQQATTTVTPLRQPTATPIRTTASQETINQAVARPAAAPQTQRTVITPEQVARQEEPQEETMEVQGGEIEGEGTEPSPIDDELDGMFGNLMPN